MTKIGTTWTKFEERGGAQFRDDGTLRERLQNERQGQRERKRRRQGACSKAKWQKEQEGKVQASPELSKENRKVGDIAESAGHCGRTGHTSSECRWGVDNVDEDV